MFGAINMASGAKIGPRVDRLVNRIAKSAYSKPSKCEGRRRRPGIEISAIIRRDYVRTLRRHLAYQGVKSLILACGRIFANFNRQSIEMLTVERFHEIAAELSVEVCALPYSNPGGLALRGFYAPTAAWRLQRPLIYVNTAHHPLAAMTTFLHELGHHLACDLWGLPQRDVHLFDTDYRAHLRMPHELGADIVVSIAGYPKPLARRLFPMGWNHGLVAQARDLGDATIQDIHKHLGGAYGFNIVNCASREQALHYLAGMIHYAKLRWALLGEFDI